MIKFIQASSYGMRNISWKSVVRMQWLPPQELSPIQQQW